MGCDIHWAIERRHRDGKWECVSSKPWARQAITGPGFANYEAFMGTPADQLGTRDYCLFAMLSGVRSVDDDAEGIVRPGLPDDISSGGRDFQGSFDIDGHSHGWLTLGEVETQAARLLAEAGERGGEQMHTPTDSRRSVDIDVDDDADVDEATAELIYGSRSLQGWLEALRQVVADPKLAGQILVGEPYEESSDDAYPAMGRLTAHERVALVKRFQELEPIGPDTVRVLIHYDN